MVHSRARETKTQERTAKYRSWLRGETEADDDVDPSDAFVELIQQDPVVCDNCFVTKYDRITAEWWRGSFGWNDYEQWVPRPTSTESVPGDEPSDGTRLVCGNCGLAGVKRRPVPKHEMEEHVENIAATLEEKAVECDEEVLMHEVRARNTSSNQGRQDSHVFAPAVELAIQAVRGVQR